MRWNSLDKKRLGEDDLGNIRYVVKFLFLPKKLDEEWRWLESVDIEQKVYRYDVGGSMDYGNYRYKFFDDHWVDEKEVGLCQKQKKLSKTSFITRALMELGKRLSMR